MTQLSDIYRKIRNSKNQKEEAKKHSLQGMSEADISASKKAGGEFYRGKVRDLIKQQNALRIVHSDRLTAFDKFIDLVPHKGTILNTISAHWLQRANELVPTHLIEKVNDRELKVEAMNPIKIEVIVRGYLAGSMARAYAKGERQFCGNTLPDGLKPNEKLPERIITPTTKAEVFEHDENISASQAVAMGLCTETEWDRIATMALQLFELGTQVNEEFGWILVDTKYEFGKDDQGNIKVIDEIHTPDSSRFWIAETYASRLKEGKSPDMLDKEIVRRWLMEHDYAGEGDVPEVPTEVLLDLGEVYLKVAETLTGKPLEIQS